MSNETDIADWIEREREGARQTGYFNDTRCFVQNIDVIVAALRRVPAQETTAEDFCTSGPPSERKRQWLVYFADPDKGIMTFDNEAEAHTAWDRAKDNWTCTLFETSARKFEWRAGQLRPLADFPAERTEDSAFEEIMRHVNAMRLSRVSEGLDRIEEICKRQSRQSPAVTETCMLCADDDSPGFYQGCMVRDGHAPEWDCDGKGNLTRRSQPESGREEALYEAGKITRKTTEEPRG